MKKILILFVVSLLLTSCLIDIIEDVKPTYVDAKSLEELLIGVNTSTYPTLKDTIEFPILGWEGVSNRQLKIEKFKEAREAGLNLSLGGFSNVDSLQKALDLAQEVGMKIFVWCPELKSNTLETVRRFQHHPANAGYFLQDEPSASEIGNLSKLNRIIESIDNTRFSYINLHPNTGTPTTLNAGDYNDYVNRFISEIPLKLLSFDHYPIEKNTIRYIWYQNLEIIREETLKANIPFWAFALTAAHWSYPIPTQEHLRLQVYSNLAYGAKGIQYFTFRMPTNRDHYISAPIDRNGNKTQEYYLVQELNKEIQALSYVFLSSDVIKVSHYGIDFPGTKSLTTFPPNVKSLKIRGGSALISELKNQSNTFFMLQNNNLLSEIGVQIEADNATRLLLKNGTIIPVSLIKDEFKLEPGDMVLFMR